MLAMCVLVKPNKDFCRMSRAYNSECRATRKWTALTTHGRGTLGDKPNSTKVPKTSNDMHIAISSIDASLIRGLTTTTDPPPADVDKKKPEEGSDEAVITHRQYTSVNKLDL
jgi:hypothetical protein